MNQNAMEWSHPCPLCWVRHQARPSEEGTPKVLGLYFWNALSLLQALPTYHTLSSRLAISLLSSSSSFPCQNVTFPT
jgi:hypothetical protein